MLGRTAGPGQAPVRTESGRLWHLAVVKASPLGSEATLAYIFLFCVGSRMLERHVGGRSHSSLRLVPDVTNARHRLH